MVWDKGLNFRGTSGYVTDGANETYVIGTDSYPTTRNGVTFGEEDDLQFHLDRASGNDRRLAGLIGDPTAGERFRVDLPATGDYEISLAIGDAVSGQTQRWTLRDDTSTLDTYSFTSGANSFRDASGVDRTAAAWPADNVAITRTFASTILRLQVETGTATSAIAHLFVSQVVAGGLSIPIAMRHYLRMMGAG